MAGYIEAAVDRAAEDASPALIVQLEHPRWLPRCDAADRVRAARGARPGHRLGRAQRWTCSQCRDVHHAGGQPRVHGARHEHRRGVPVGSGGEDLTGTIGEKVKNDAIANIRSVAETRGRNVDWAVSTVDKAVSSSAVEAVRLGAVDGIATSIEDVRRQADGQVVTVASQPVTIDIADAPLVDLPMNPFQSFIHLLSDPNVAFILLTIGFYGLLFEVQSPNFVTGIVGAIALVLAFIGFGSLPLNVAGLLLILLAIVLFVLEFTVTSHGLLAIGGLICFVLGAFTLYTAPGSPTAPDVTVATPLILGMAIATRRVRRAGARDGGAGPATELRVRRDVRRRRQPHRAGWE